MTTKYYVFSEKTGKCYLLDEEKSKKELELISKNSFQWKYKHNNANLTIEKLGNKVITARLETDHNIEGIIQAWEDEDRGRAVWDEEKKDYVLKYGLSKIFYFFNNQHKKRPWKFTFHQHHLILKDKDEQKPYYWYYYDYTDELSTFIYEELKWFIKPEQGEIVAIPSERGQAIYTWGDLGYNTNDHYCGEDEEYKDYNFAAETAENWKKNHYLPTALVITFLPTYFKNYELKRGEKLTGTTWFKKIWEVFGKRGIPIVVKCYRSWVYINLYRHYRTLYDQISSITELPAEIDDREVGKSNLLVYFNMPFLPKKINYKRYKPWWEEEETKNEEDIKPNQPK